MNDANARAELGRRARSAFDEAYCDVRTLPQFDALFAGLVVPAEGELNYEVTKGTKRLSESSTSGRKEAVELVSHSKA
jgi:hypothetical protein